MLSTSMGVHALKLHYGRLKWETSTALCHLIRNNTRTCYVSCHCSSDSVSYCITKCSVYRLQNECLWSTFSVSFENLCLLIFWTSRSRKDPPSPCFHIKDMPMSQMAAVKCSFSSVPTPCGQKNREGRGLQNIGRNSKNYDGIARR